MKIPGSGPLIFLVVVLGLAPAVLAWPEAPPPQEGPPAPEAPSAHENPPAATQEPQPRVRAPEFPDGLQWLNTDRPLRMADLRGKVVLLDFWTYGCINCLHIIPDLKYLEARYAKELVVIGVHSAKFPNESASDNIRQAILRYGLEHPVVNDHEFLIWRTYGVQAWPTLVLIDPEGYVLGGVAGEGHRELLDEVIGEVIQTARARGLLREAPLALRLERDKLPATELSYPGKVLADAASGRLFIADSNHHRLVITDLEGQVQDMVGSGKPGTDDGPFEQATFRWPQGMALDGERLYVADTENHLIREVDLRARTVRTVAGTGQQARQLNVPGRGREAALNSPWDLRLIGRQLYIAMAGSHQIWVMDLETSTLSPFAGTGEEQITDGPRLEGALAQPSGLATDGRALYVADSEVSGLRSVDLGPTGTLRTIVGAGLFEFGDRDGAGREVRLQHPLGVEYHQDQLYVADTYNHKIKLVDPARGTVRTYLGSGSPGFRDGQAAEFYEPSGLSIAGGKLYIADTNNHAIRVVDLASGTVSTLQLRRLTASSASAGFTGLNWTPRQTIALPKQRLAPGATGQLTVDLRLPPGYKLNPQAVLIYRLMVKGEGLEIPTEARTFSGQPEALPLRIPFHTAAGIYWAEVILDLTFYYCTQDEKGVCVVRSLSWQVPVETADGAGAREIVLAYAAPAPEVFLGPGGLRR